MTTSALLKWSSTCGSVAVVLFQDITDGYRGRLKHLLKGVQEDGFQSLGRMRRDHQRFLMLEKGPDRALGCEKDILIPGMDRLGRKQIRRRLSGYRN